MALLCGSLTKAQVPEHLNTTQYEDTDQRSQISIGTGDNANPVVELHVLRRLNHAAKNKYSMQLNYDQSYRFP